MAATDESTAETKSLTPSKDSDSDIYTALMRGEEQGWIDFYEYFAPRLNSLFEGKGVYLTSDREELLQETVMTIFQHLSRYDPTQASFRSWVYGVARNIMHRHQKDYYHQYHDETTGDDALEQVSLERYERNTGIADHGTDHASIAALQAALAALPEKYRQILNLRHGRGATWSVLAAELGIGVSAAKMRHQRAKDMLRGMLDL